MMPWDFPENHNLHPTVRLSFSVCKSADKGIRLQTPPFLREADFSDKQRIPACEMLWAHPNILGSGLSRSAAIRNGEQIYEYSISVHENSAIVSLNLNGSGGRNRFVPPEI
jgi:hypothetical protein